MNKSLSQSPTNLLKSEFSKSLNSWPLFDGTYDKMPNGPRLKKHLPANKAAKVFPNQDVSLA